MFPLSDDTFWYFLGLAERNYNLPCSVPGGAEEDIWVMMATRENTYSQSDMLSLDSRSNMYRLSLFPGSCLKQTYIHVISVSSIYMA